MVILAVHDSRAEHLASLLEARGLAAVVVGESEDLVSVIDRVEGPIGLFGDSRVLLAANRRPEVVSAVVTCGDHHELAISDLEAIRAPTLFVVGSSDLFGLQRARSHARKMIASTRVLAVPGANAAFTQPGAFDEIAEHATQWFEEHFSRWCPPKLAAAR